MFAQVWRDMASPSDAANVLRSTREKENFQRLSRLLMCGGVGLLREKFDSFHSPANLPLKLANPAIQGQLIRSRISQAEWNSLYPSPGTFGKSSDFDITLTFRLLRTICNLREPLTGWDNLPNSTDHSLEADLARIKFYRNTVYSHNSTMEIADSEFSNLWREISEALLRIAGSITQAKRDEWRNSIDKLLHDPLTPEAQRYVDELQSWYRYEMEVREAVEQLGDQLQQVNVDVRDQLQQVNVNLEDQLQQVNVDVRDQLQQVNVNLGDQLQQVNVDVRDQLQQVNEYLGDQLQQFNQRLGKLSKGKYSNLLKMTLLREEGGLQDYSLARCFFPLTNKTVKKQCMIHKLAMHDFFA